MRRRFPWASRLTVVGLALLLLGSVSMAVGLLLLASNIDVFGTGAFFLSSALVAGGAVAMIVSFVLE